MLKIEMKNIELTILIIAFAFISTVEAGDRGYIFLRGGSPYLLE